MDEIQSLFNARALHWDEARAPDPEKLRMMVTLSDVRKNSVVLDVGCGTGVLVPYLLERKPSYILGVDFAPKMIEIARKKWSDSGIEFRCADIFSLSDIRCDRCFLYNTLPHFPDPGLLLEHLATLVKPGGRLTISNRQGVRYVNSLPSPVGFPLPAQGVWQLMRPFFRIDAAVDNNALLLVSGVRLPPR